MASSMTTLLIVAFASLFLGVVAGLLLNSLRGDSEQEAQADPETPPGGRPGGYVPVVRLWREKTTGTLVVEIDGKAYLSPGPLSLTQRDNLEKVLAQLAGWLRVSVTAGPEKAAGSPDASEQSPSAAAPVAAVGIDNGKPLITPPPATVTPVARAEAKPAAQTAAKEGPKSIVGQIDEILQQMLDRLGMSNRGISLIEDPQRGVIVVVGLERYEGIDSVTDVEVKKILRAAVNEWERRQERPLR